MSTTVRYPIKPRTVTLLELCQSITDLRRPPPSLSSYQYQSTPNAAQILTRRLYLHPLSINPTSKQQPSKIPTTAVTLPDIDQRHQLNSDKKRETKNAKHKSHCGLAILSSSFPLITRMNTKTSPRQSRDKVSIHTDDEIYSEGDTSSTTISFNQHTLPAIARGTLSSTHTVCTRSYCHVNVQKTYPKRSNHWERVNVWHHLDRSLKRPIPNDPPTTPRDMSPVFNRENDPQTVAFDIPSYDNIQNDEEQKGYPIYNSIQEIKIYKRNQVRKSRIDEYDDIYDEEYLM
jgi:hypothetical protein